MRLFIYTIALATVVHGAPALPPLQVNTGSGTLQGFINSSAPAVRQFLGVPFALPPTGPRRWLPPAAITLPTPTVNATSFSPSCPQIALSATPTANVFTASGGNQTEFFPLEVFSEDCLTLNVWAPACPQAAMLPVIVWFFGGGFTQGGADSLYFNAAAWVQRTQAHIVVSVNFRSNIFGFPNAAGLADQNLGLLDQRAALEWVRDSIAAFGGDASRIVDWGESAGAIAVDYLNFAFPTDPIAAGFIMDSGTALFNQSVVQTNDTAQKNFAEVAAQLGCGSAASQIDCLRSVSWQSIVALLTSSGLSFVTVPDERVVFANYTARYAAGKFARVPALIGTNQHELNALLPHFPGGPFNDNSISDLQTNKSFLCFSAVATTQLREANGLTTYRFRYDGNFTNISSPEFPGAYHASELPLIFGTAGQYHGASTPYEDEVSMKLQDLWLAFVQDPEKGLQSAGWEPYAAGQAVLLGGDDTPLREIDVQDLDGVCSTF